LRERGRAARWSLPPDQTHPQCHDPYEWEAAAIRRNLLARELRLILSRGRQARIQNEYVALDQIADPIVVLDRSSRVVFANARAGELEVVGLEGTPGKVQLTRSLAAELRAHGRSGRDHAEPLRFEWRPAEPGPLFEVSGWIDGEHTTLQLHDVTVERRAFDALQASERRYRELAESSFDVVALFRSDWTLLDANRQWEEVYGYKRDELMGTQGIRDLLRPTTRAKLAEAIKQAPTEPGPLPRYDIDLLDKDGRLRHIEFSFRIFRTPGKQSLVQVIGRDVTEQRDLAERLQRSEKLEALGRLAGGVAHDFNNVLLVVRGAAALLRLGTKTQDSLDLIDEIDRESTRATALVRQLLAYARSQVVQPTLVELTATVDEMERMLSRLVGESITLRIEARAGAQQVLGDRSRIEQVLLNLVLNARDAIRETGSATGTITIATDTHRAETDSHPQWGECPPGDYVALSVSDTGTGMDLEREPLIFEPFFSSKGLENSGLGLATVYGVTTQMGGGIDVQSTLGEGSTFTVYLPLALEGAAPAARPLPPIAEPERPAAAATVLLVEDEEGPRRLLQRILNEAGYRVVASGQPCEALELVEAGAAIDLLLTDVVMPEMSGPQLASRVRARRPSLPVVFMTGYSDAPLELNGETLLEKPFTPADLALEIRRALHRTPDPREEPT
jgi:two-component system cell cycle sensor histidine kinase/response regulator CckA